MAREDQEWRRFDEFSIQLIDMIDFFPARSLADRAVVNLFQHVNRAYFFHGFILAVNE
jgi:hypothetical protein